MAILNHCKTLSAAVRLADAAEGGEFAGIVAGGALAGQARAREIGPGAVGIVAQIKGKVARGFVFAADAFVGQCEVQVRVGHLRGELDGFAQMGDGGDGFAVVFEHAAEIELRQRIAGIELHGERKFLARFGHAFELIERGAVVDVRLNPLGRERDGARPALRNGILQGGVDRVGGLRERLELAPLDVIAISNQYSAV